MRDRLALLVRQHPRRVSEAELIREAIRRYLDEQEDLAGSRKHFQKSFQDRLDRLEGLMLFQFNILFSLISDESSEALRQAIITANRDGDTWQKQIQAVRALKRKSESR